MSSPNVFRLDQSEILLFGEELTCYILKEICTRGLNPFPDNKSIDSSKLKEFVDKISNWMKMAESFSNG